MDRTNISGKFFEPLPKIFEVLCDFFALQMLSMKTNNFFHHYEPRDQELLKDTLTVNFFSIETPLEYLPNLLESK